MGNFKILFEGMALSFRKRRLVARLWAVNLLFSLFAVAPFFFMMTTHMSRSFSGERTLQKLDIGWLSDFIYHYLNVAPALTGTALLALALYLLLSVFLNGGIIGCLSRPEAKTTLADFFHDCGLYFWSFLRLFLVSIPVYLAALGIFFPLLKAFLNMFARRATTEWPALIASNLRFLFLVLLLTVVSMFFDYVKIGLAGNGRKKVWQEIKRTVGFIGRRFFRAWGLFLLAGLVFVALTLFYLEIARIMPKAKAHWVLVFFLWQQFYILCRQWSKVLFFASGLTFVEKYKEPI
jgi:hypothetical protein